MHAGVNLRWFFLGLLALLWFFLAGAQAEIHGRLYHRVLVKDIPETIHTHVCTTGLVTLIKKEADGDIHIRVENGDGTGAFIVGEVIPTLRASRGVIVIPKVGQWIELCGIVREDKKHSWFEIHPIERMK